MSGEKTIVGVLALQGAFLEHIDYFKRAVKDTHVESQLGFIDVRTKEHLSTCHGLVIPGGESTSMSLIAKRTGILDPLKEFVKSGKPVWGTCAGLIFLSKEIVGGKPEQEILGGLDIRVVRNAFGRQLDSFHKPLDFSFFIEGLHSFPAVFIRAPVVSAILNTGESDGQNDSQVAENENIIRSTNDFCNQAPVEILHELDNGMIVAVRQGNILGTSFHPELSDDYRFHKWFIEEFILKTKII